VVRLAYRAAGHAFGLILSVDGRGAVTLHLPERGGLAAPLDTDAEVPLDHAYELDDAPRWERFYFVVGDAPFEVAPVVAVARRVATQHPSRAPERLGLPPHLRQSGITLRKGDR
jgi:hypothetical protein